MIASCCVCRYLWFVVCVRFCMCVVARAFLVVMSCVVLCLFVFGLVWVLGAFGVDVVVVVVVVVVGAVGFCWCLCGCSCRVLLVFGF